MYTRPCSSRRTRGVCTLWKLLSCFVAFFFHYYYFVFFFSLIFVRLGFITTYYEYLRNRNPNQFIQYTYLMRICNIHIHYNFFLLAYTNFHTFCGVPGRNPDSETSRSVRNPDG